MTEAQRKKLIEVALPLEEINEACKADKGRKTGTIRNLHKWFAPAPLPAWRALLFAALIDDPGDDVVRAELLELIKRLVANGADLPDQGVLAEAKAVIARQFPGGAPTVMDPFCGGGSTLVEAQRLGLPTYGSDLNPVPALITRTLTETLPKIYGLQPLHPAPVEGPRPGKPYEEAVGQTGFSLESAGRTYSEYEGLIHDVRHYATQTLRRAAEELAEQYPSSESETPIAWLWARTVACPNPACGTETILTTSWWLSKKTGDLAWVEPRISGGLVELAVVSGQRHGTAPDTPKSGRGTFACLKCGATLDEKYLRGQGQRGGLGMRMTAVVAEVDGRRIYRAPTSRDLLAAESVTPPRGIADTQLVGWATKNVPLYGVDTWDKLYTPRQLLTLSAFADLVGGVHQEVLDDGGTSDWADAVAALLALALGKLAQANSTQNRWNIRGAKYQAKAEPAFARNDLPMTWDFAETYFDGKSVGDWLGAVSSTLRGIAFAVPGSGRVERVDARESGLAGCLVATDPPYFDAIGYADLSDYFYVWHRRALKEVFPDLYGMVAAPKTNELTAIPSHHGGSKDAARTYFIDGFTKTFENLKASMGANLPMLVIYASKEQKSGQGEETRWESILTAMIDGDLEITAAWPVHMTGSTRMVSIGTNAVAAYIVLACRPRSTSAPTTSLNDFARALRREMPAAIRNLQAGSILPVDLYQAALGPGMQIYSRYRSVEDSHGMRVTVSRALELITAAIGSVLDEQEGELDSASRFAVTWWEQYGWNPGPFGEADKAARGYGTHVDDVVRAEVVTALPGKGVQLLGADSLDREWNPASDAKPTAWEAVHHLADRLINGGGESEAAALLAQLGDLQDSSRTLAYRLHDIAAKKGWAKDQERYNALIGQWSSMLALAATHNPEGLF